MSAVREFWLLPDPLVLASGSAARRHLLEQAGIPVTVKPAAVDERGIERPLAEAGAEADAMALRLARAKALWASARSPGALVLGGDQTLSLGARQLHKPEGLGAAVDQLAALSGQTHRLNSAVVLARDGTVLFETVCPARMTMRVLSSAFVARYLAAMGASVCDSVGAYKLEGLGIHLFERIEGDQSTVMGLPLLPVLAALRRLGALAG